jgi:hypothetical protein
VVVVLLVAVRRQVVLVAHLLMVLLGKVLLVQMEKAIGIQVVVVVLVELVLVNPLQEALEFNILLLALIFGAAAVVALATQILVVTVELVAVAVAP